jgi:flavin-dependent dehydrogenase
VETDVEIVVIGAGPAGCGAARMLALWGHRVMLVHRPRRDDRSLAVSIPPSARRTLSAFGVAEAVDRAGFQPWRGNTVWWGNRQARVESFAPGLAGYQVVSSELDQLLRRLAGEAGARIETGRVTVARLPETEADLPAVTIETDGHPRSEVRPPFLVDCSGRSGVIARQGLRRAEPSHRTVALSGLWHSASGWTLAEDTHTLVASYVDGWAWSVSTAPGIWYVTVMVDPERTDLAHGQRPLAVYRAELAKVEPFQPLIERGSLVAGPWGHDASLYDARTYAGPGYLLVGDAASFLDPLSSFGVKKALASAWVAAVAVHTALVHRAMAQEALAFHDRRERSVYAAYRRQSAAFASDAAHASGQPFWLARADVPDGLERVDEDGAIFAQDAATVAAFDDLRRRAAVNLRRSTTVRTVRCPAIHGHELLLEDHIILPDRPEGVRYIRGVDLMAVAGLAPNHFSVGEMYEAYVRQYAPAALPDFLGVLSLLIARGVLQHAEV